MDKNRITAVLVQTDLLELAEQAGAILKQNGKEWRSACPLHKGNNETSFVIYPGSDGLYRWQCYADCDNGGDAIEFVKAWKGLDFLRAVEYLGGKDDIDPEELARIATERAKKAAERLEEEIRKAQRILEDLRETEKHLKYHENMQSWAREEWQRRGLGDWMEFWYLGGCEDFTINNGYHTPTITIPIFNESREVLNIRHRLMKPQDPKDKYRPETTGLKAVPFLALPELGYDGDVVLVVEGEIKAAVTYSTIGGMDIQVIGVPGQGMYKHLFDKLEGKEVVICPDPGAEQTALDFAKRIGGRYFTLPSKIDDWILETQADRNDIYAFIKQARKI